MRQPGSCRRFHMAGWVGGGLVLALAASPACQSAGNQTNLPPPASPSGAPSAEGVAGNSSKPVTNAASVTASGTSVTTVTQALGQAPGAEVEVTGLYFGWKGPCRGQPPTRSAWQLVESAEPAAPCIYVDGPNIPGVAANLPPANLLVVVHGKYKVDGDLRYIEADKVEKK
jgi:hypothetical protein